MKVSEMPIPAATSSALSFPGDAGGTPSQAPSPAPRNRPHLTAVAPDVRSIQDAVLPVSPLPLSLFSLLCI